MKIQLEILLITTTTTTTTKFSIINENITEMLLITIIVLSLHLYGTFLSQPDSLCCWATQDNILLNTNTKELYYS